MRNWLFLLFFFQIFALSGCSVSDVNKTAMVLAAAAGVKYKKTDPVRSTQYTNIANTYAKNEEIRRNEIDAKRTGKADSCLQFDDPKRGRILARNICGIVVYQIVIMHPIDDFDGDKYHYTAYGIGPNNNHPFPYDDDDKWTYSLGDICSLKPLKITSRAEPIRCPVP